MQINSSEQVLDREGQLAEVEMMEAAYGESFRLVQSESNFTSRDIAFDIVLPGQISIRLYVPPSFPASKIRFFLNSAQEISNDEKNKISSAIQRAIDDSSDNDAMGSLEICQMAVDLCREWLENRKNNKSTKGCSNKAPSIDKKRLARFLIYFHHIKSGKKRQAIVNNARDLNLGGFSKQGFPGIVVVEGCDVDVLEFVKRIQHLRWQHMVVRGEEFDDFIEESDNVMLNRKLPMPFTEIDSEKMSDIASLCKNCDCHDLFMTSLKKTF